MGKFGQFTINNHHYILSIFAVIALLYNTSLYFRLTDWGNYARYCELHRIGMFEEDEYLQKAVDMWSRFAKEPAEITMRRTYPNVVKLDKDVCVSLTPLDLAGEPVYCFDKKSKHPTYVSQNVE